MISNLRPYPAYKDSGVEWLGQVPAHWEVRRLGSVTQILNGATPSSSRPEYWDGDIVWVTPDDLGKLKGRYIDNSSRRITREGYNACGTTLAPVGSIVVSTRAPIGHLGILRVAACANQGCRLLVPQAPTASEYLYYALVAARPSLEVFGQGSTFLELSRSKLRAFPVPFPPLPEQTAIVRFLDYKDRRIRRSIRGKQKLVKLLEEYKQALIHQAVTGRIDVRTGKPYPAYKSSGVEWLGEVPEHWELKPLKRWVRLNASVLPDTTPADYEFRYIDIGMVGTGFLTREPQRLRFGNAPSRARRVLHMGDTIISTVRTYLKAVYYVDGDAEDLVCSTGFAVLTPGPSTQPKYVSYLVQSNTFTDHVTAESVGTAYPAIAEGRLGSFHVPIPPLPEQTAIVEYLDAQTAKIDAAIAAARREIELLREYRERLIADVVTGKVDVREVSERLPEEPEEPELLQEEAEPLSDESEETIEALSADEESED